MLKVLFTAAVLLSACVPGAYGSFGSFGGGTTTTTTTSTSVYINGIELTYAQEAQLEAILGQIPPGRYFVTESGFMGIEGQSASVDIKPAVAAYQARHGNGGGNRNGGNRGTAALDGRGGGVVFDGNCTIASAPDGTTFSSGC